MPIYVYQRNKQISTNAIRNNKVVKAIYAKEQGQDAVCVWGDDVAYSLFTYTIQNNAVTITGLNPNYQFSGNLLIPSKIKGKPVTIIGNSAFSDCTGLTSVTIPNSVTSLDYRAFYNCTGLTSITIPNSVRSIGSYAFYGCTGLTSVAGSTTNASTVAKQAKPTSFTVNITSGTSIGQEAFSGCTGLTSITIPSSVTNIGSSAFKDCVNLTNITIPESVTSIDRSAFNKCTGLMSITIPNSVTSIGKGAFEGCGGLTSITLPFVGAKAGVTSNDTYQYPFGYIFGSSEYNGSYSAIQYYYGSSTSSTTYTTYYIPSSLKSVTVTGGNILYGAFYDCSSLTNITIPDSVTSIGGRAFYACQGLRSVIIPDGVTSIDDKTFYLCEGLTSITIPDRVTSIGYSAFYYCKGLTSITFNGTIAQWNTVSKGADWNYNTGNYTIHCTDGDIPK